MTLTVADRELLREAAATLDGVALELRMCSTVAPEHTDWRDDEQARAIYEHDKALVNELYALAGRDETPSAVTP